MVLLKGINEGRRLLWSLFYMKALYFHKKIVYFLYLQNCK
jgi:hypothetical protein